MNPQYATSWPSCDFPLHERTDDSPIHVPSHGYYSSATQKSSKHFSQSPSNLAPRTPHLSQISHYSESLLQIKGPRYEKVHKSSKVTAQQTNLVRNKISSIWYHRFTIWSDPENLRKSTVPSLLEAVLSRLTQKAKGTKSWIWRTSWETWRLSSWASRNT